MDQTLTFSDLQHLTGYKRQSDVERCLKKQLIPFLVGRDGPFTTLTALNQSLGVRQYAETHQKIEFGT